MTDRIELRGLRVRGRHGVRPGERDRGQLFVVDAAVEFDTSAAAASDRLDDTVDYASLAARLREVVAGPPVALLETLADRLVRTCLDSDRRVLAATVTVHKPEAPLPATLDDVTVTVRRTRR